VRGRVHALRGAPMRRGARSLACGARGWPAEAGYALRGEGARSAARAAMIGIAGRVGARTIAIRQPDVAGRQALALRAHLARGASLAAAATVERVAVEVAARDLLTACRAWRESCSTCARSCRAD